MATDFVHTADVMEAVRDVLLGEGANHTGGLPASWFDQDDADHVPLIGMGYVADYGVLNFDKDLPAILVRGLGVELIGGHQAKTWHTAERIRVVHVRKFEQCYHATTEPDKSNMTLARAWYAKQISKALFNDPKKLLAVIAADDSRTEVSLTCTDTDGAAIVDCVFRRWDLGDDIGNPEATEDVRIIAELNARMWAIACDFDVHIQNG